MDWNKAVKETFGQKTTITFPRFYPSKKNQVTLLFLDIDGKEEKIISKFYSWGDADKEWDILSRASKMGIAVPKPVKRYENIVFMEYIPGKTLYQILDYGDELIPCQVGKWIAEFHKGFQKGGSTLLKGDGVLPNFILHPDSLEIYGIDFEEARYGDPITDIGELFVSLFLLKSPQDPDPFFLSRIFLNSYLEENKIIFEEKRLKQVLIEELQRREMFIPSRRKDFLAFSDRINRDQHGCFYTPRGINLMR